MNKILYHVERTRKQVSRVLFNMGIGCWVYIVGFYIYDNYSNTPTFLGDDGHIVISAFVGASIILFAFAIWHLRNPATYSVTVTSERFIIHYPGSKKWSFDVAIADIKRFEHRNTLSHAGQGHPEVGVLLKNGKFHHISLNYFNGTGKFSDLITGGPVGEMHRAVQQINPDITYPKAMNTKVEGFLKRDYSD